MSENREFHLVGRFKAVLEIHWAECVESVASKHGNQNVGINSWAEVSVRGQVGPFFVLCDDFRRRPCEIIPRRESAEFTAILTEFVENGVRREFVSVGAVFVGDRLGIEGVPSDFAQILPIMGNDDSSLEVSAGRQAASRGRRCLGRGGVGRMLIPSGSLHALPNRLPELGIFHGGTRRKQKEAGKGEEAVHIHAAFIWLAVQRHGRGILHAESDVSWDLRENTVLWGDINVG